MRVESKFQISWETWHCYIYIFDIALVDIKKWQDYTEPGDELDPGSPLRRTSRNLDDDTAEGLPLPEGVLTTNLGLDVVVVITKTDYMSTLEKEQDYKWASNEWRICSNKSLANINFVWLFTFFL